MHRAVQAVRLPVGLSAARRLLHPAAVAAQAEAGSLGILVGDAELVTGPSQLAEIDIAENYPGDELKTEWHSLIRDLPRYAYMLRPKAGQHLALVEPRLAVLGAIVDADGPVVASGNRLPEA